MAKKKTPRGGGGFASRGASRGHRAAGPGRPATPGRAHPGPGRDERISPNRRTGFAGGERPYDYSHYESEPATRDYMSRLFARHRFAVTAEQLERFWRYYLLLREHNARLDLTRIMGIEATVLKHFIDSALILDHVKLTGPVLDIGSGPGFPGVPLAVMRPELEFILGESRGKRVTFLEMVVKELGLGNVTLFPKSVRDDSPLGDDYSRPVGDVVTRALETIAPTLERIRPFLRPGGQAVFMKGPAADNEVAEASAAFAGAFTLQGDIEYVLPDTDQKRRLVVFRKDEPL